MSCKVYGKRHATDRANAPFAHVAGLHGLVKGVADAKAHVLNEHSLQVWLHAAVVHMDAGGRPHRDHIELAAFKLVREERALSDDRAQPPSLFGRDSDCHAANSPRLVHT